MLPATPQDAPDVPLQRKVAFLRDPASYPERPFRVEVKETHYSFVFLHDRHACKLKKPVSDGALDYSTLEARRRHCESEVALNGRLAPSIYLGCARLTCDAHGELALDGAGFVVDWLVKMRRLHRHDTLEQAIRRGRRVDADVRRLAERLVRFFREAPDVVLSAAAYRERFEADIAYDLAELRQPRFELAPDLPTELARVQRHLLAVRGGLFDERVADFRVVEGHGDLRPEHVYLEREPLVLDCIEFDPRLRALDPVDELAFLAMESECLGASHVRDLLFEVYEDRTADVAPRVLIDFYTSRRAMARARASICHLANPTCSEPQRWRLRCQRYLDAAARHAHGFLTA